jgi:hypothetical protein
MYSNLTNLVHLPLVNRALLSSGKPNVLTMDELPEPINSVQTISLNTANRKAFVSLAAPSFIYLLVTYVLPPPLPIRPEAYLVEPSWQLVLTEGFLRGAQFGRDIIYTYGPWGFVDIPRGNPRIYPWLLGARLLIALAFVLGVSLIATRKIRRPAGRFLFVVGIALLSDPVSVLPMILLAAVLCADRERDRAASPIIHIMAIACALTMWIKFTSFVIVGALAAALAVQDLMRRRRPVISVEILAAALAFWLLARQSLLGLPSFLHGALSAAGSYSAEMFLPGPYAELGLVVILILATAAPAAALFYYDRPWYLWPTLSWVALLFFLQLKEAFVRYDPFHIWMGIINALLPCALILVCATGSFNPETSRPPAMRILTRACAAWVVLLSVMFTGMEIRTAAGFERYQALLQNLGGVRRLVAGGSLAADYQAQLERFRHQAPLQKVSGTAEVFPDSQALLYGNGLQARLPPVPQSFGAYNSYLSGQNASFFRGANRPDFVFFEIAPIDTRYPSSADALSWLALMDCYRPSGNSGPYLVLRAAACEDASLDLITETKTRAGQSVAVPAGDGYAVWAQIDLRLNYAGSIVAALARPPQTRLAIHTGTGSGVFSISAETARTGFLLSPLLLDSTAFGRLLAEGKAEERIDPRTEVRDLAIVEPGLAPRFYESAIGVRLYKIRPRQSVQARR